MVLLLLVPIATAIYVLLAHGGCDYHKVENGHVPDRFWRRVW